MIRGEIHIKPDGSLQCIVYDNEVLQKTAQSIIGLEVIHKGKVIGKISRADVIDGKILWETQDIPQTL
jgi:hypothetical protein